MSSQPSSSNVASAAVRDSVVPDEKGQQAVRHALAKRQDLSVFQEQQYFKFPEIKPAVEFLAAARVPKHITHENILLISRTVLMENIKRMPREAVHKILQQLFYFINFPRIRPVVLSCLGQVDTIEEVFLNSIRNDRQLVTVRVLCAYWCCIHLTLDFVLLQRLPLTARRQIWTYAPQHLTIDRWNIIAPFIAAAQRRSAMAPLEAVPMGMKADRPIPRHITEV